MPEERYRIVVESFTGPRVGGPLRCRLSKRPPVHLEAAVARRSSQPPFCHQDHPGPVPEDHLEPIFPFRPEDENIAAVGIGPQCLRDHRDQAMDPTAEINRPRRHQYPQLAAKAYHDARRSAGKTTESVLASTPSGT